MMELWVNTARVFARVHVYVCVCAFVFVTDGCIQLDK